MKALSVTISLLLSATVFANPVSSMECKLEHSWESELGFHDTPIQMSEWQAVGEGLESSGKGQFAQTEVSIVARRSSLKSKISYSFVLVHASGNSVVGGNWVSLRIPESRGPDDQVFNFARDYCRTE